MKKLLFGLMAGGFVAAMLFAGGCRLSSSNPNYTEFSIQVDSIQHPDTITYGNSLTIKFYGTIGPSTCYSFSRIVGGINGNTINLQVLGKYANNQNACESTPQYLDGDSLIMNQLTPGSFIIHVMEPAPPDIYDTVYVTQQLTSVSHK